ncbi:MAG: hypothetical protein J0M16_12660 [Gammaproteobacteria bacterium]|nr:hypothetical protein [Gammaproteobacteria bacterium]
MLRFHRSRLAVVLLAASGALALSGPARAATIEFFDGTFADADWTVAKISDNTPGAGASFTATQVATGGNPGEYREVIHVYGLGSIIVGYLRNAATFDPSVSGSIVSLAYSYDTQRLQLNTGAVAYTPVIFQNNTWYGLPAYDTTTNQAWTSFGLSGLTAASFIARVGSGPAAPDFSATGAPMVFGYLSANTNTNAAVTATRSAGIDNWRVEVTTANVPLPAGGWLLATGVVAIAARYRHRAA